MAYSTGDPLFDLAAQIQRQGALALAGQSAGGGSPPIRVQPSGNGVDIFIQPGGGRPPTTKAVPGATAREVKPAVPPLPASDPRTSQGAYGGLGESWDSTLPTEGPLPELDAAPALSAPDAAPNLYADSQAASGEPPSQEEAGFIANMLPETWRGPVVDALSALAGAGPRTGVGAFGTGFALAQRSKTDRLDRKRAEQERAEDRRTAAEDRAWRMSEDEEEDRERADERRYGRSRDARSDKLADEDRTYTRGREKTADERAETASRYDELQADLQIRSALLDLEERIGGAESREELMKAREHLDKFRETLIDQYGTDFEAPVADEIKLIDDAVNRRAQELGLDPETLSPAEGADTPAKDEDSPNVSKTGRHEGVGTYEKPFVLPKFPNKELGVQYLDALVKATGGKPIYFRNSVGGEIRSYP